MIGRLLSAIAIISLAVLLSAQPAVTQTSIPAGAHAPGELLIRAKGAVSALELENIYKAQGGQKIAVLSQIGVHHISVPANALEKIEAALKNNPKIDFVEKNFLFGPSLVPNDPGYGSEWHLTRIAAPGGWDLTTGSTAVPIAIIDSGVDANHPDLSSKLIAGRNFLNNSSNTQDDHGHGTAVAGTAAAATNSGIGIAGVAWNNPIMPLLVWNSSTSATASGIASAITYAADNGAKVINMSLSGSSSTSTLDNAINYAWNKGLVIVASAGNNSSSSPVYPAASQNVMAVSATSDVNDTFASFSNYGNWITLSAPGDMIYTTNTGGGYWWVYGTSFSTPQVAAAAALLFSLNPNLTNAQVVDLLKKNADDVGAPGYDNYYGWGRLNVQRALQAATQTTTTTPTSVAITSPTNGTGVSGTVNVNVSASSTGGISKVELYIDGGLGGTLYTSPYTFPWNTSGYSGSHSLAAKAYDGTGGSITSSTVGINVLSSDTTPPSVQVTSVSQDSRSLKVTATASDASGITKVELYVNGVLKATDTSSPYTYKLGTKPWPSGTYAISVKAYDRAGNMASATGGSITK